VLSLGVMAGWEEERGKRALAGEGGVGVGCEEGPQRVSTAAITAGRMLVDSCCESFWRSMPGMCRSLLSLLWLSAVVTDSDGGG